MIGPALVLLLVAIGLVGATREAIRRPDPDLTWAAIGFLVNFLVWVMLACFALGSVAAVVWALLTLWGAL